MLPYHLDPNVCPSSLHENEQGELEPITPNVTAHVWDDTETPVTCSECGTTREEMPYECGSCEHAGKYPVTTEPQKGFEIFYHCEKCGYEVIPLE